ncbi:MAG: hypothetical protein H6Q73_35 [Firmicutes bacterium]|nr:hypothetical protein [Bacillota bacterium]
MNKLFELIAKYTPTALYPYSYAELQRRIKEYK